MLNGYIDILKNTYGRGERSCILILFLVVTMASSWYTCGLWLGLVFPLISWLTFVPCAIWLIDHKK